MLINSFNSKKIVTPKAGQTGVIVNKNRNDIALFDDKSVTEYVINTVITTSIVEKQQPDPQFRIAGSRSSGESST